LNAAKQNEALSHHIFSFVVFLNIHLFS